MKYLLLLIASWTFTTTVSAASILRDAILNLPPQAMAGIPLNQRRVFLDYFKEDAPKFDRRLDEKNGCVSFYSDGPVPFDAKFAFEVKIFHVIGGGDLAFCCLTDGSFIFQQKDRGWMDVTAKYLPKGIQANSYFQPRRRLAIVEGEDYRKHDAAHTKRFDLVWNGRRFNVRKAHTKTYHYDFQ